MSASFSVGWIDTFEDLQKTFWPLVGTVNKLVELLPSKGESADGAGRANSSVLADAISLIGTGRSVTEWPEGEADDFVGLLQRSAFTEARRLEGVPDKQATDGLQRVLDWAINFTKFMPPTTEPSCTRRRSNLIGVWIRSNLDADPPEDLEVAVRDAAAALVPSGLSSEELLAQAKCQAVWHVAFQRERNAASDGQLELAKTWCLEAPQERVGQFRGPAKKLGIDLAIRANAPDPVPTSEAMQDRPIEEAPRRPTDGPEPRTERRPDTPRKRVAGVWEIIDSAVARSELVAELQRLLEEFRRGAQEAHDQGFERAADELHSIAAGYQKPDVGRRLLAAVGHLWEAFCLRGNSEALSWAQKLAAFLLLWNGPGWPHYRFRALEKWLHVSLPDMFSKADVPSIVRDAKQLARQVDCNIDDTAFNEAIILAHAGLVRSRGAEGRSLVNDNLDDLRPIHDDFRKRFPLTTEEPRAISEKTAWDLLTGAEQTEPDHLWGKLRQAVMGGDPDKVYDFLAENIDEIKDRLKSRLDFRLDAGNLKRPTGNVYQPGGQRGARHPIFISGEEALRKKDFEAAVTEFRTLLQRLRRGIDARRSQRAQEANTGVITIASNYLAYAQAKATDVLGARTLLRDLCATRPVYSSIYWNYACLLPVNSAGERLDTLALGIEKAPDKDLLHAGVYLALILNDEKRLGLWLSQLTFLEAILVDYYQTFEKMDFNLKDTGLLRIRTYLDAEPVLPNPEWSQLHKRPDEKGQIDALIVAFVNTLQQPQAIEFWLDCQRSRGWKHVPYHETKVLFLETIGDPLRAAAAFADELRSRCELVENVLFGNQRRQPERRQPDGAPTLPPVFRLTRDRAEDWLRKCTATPDLKRKGEDIFRVWKQFINYLNERGFAPPAIPTHIRSYYDEKPEMGTLLAEASQACGRKLHEPSDVKHVRTELGDFIEALNRSGKTDSAKLVERLITIWSESSKGVSAEVRKASLRSAQETYATLQRSLAQGWNQDMAATSVALLNAFQRVNSRLAREIELVPAIVIEPADGRALAFDPTAGTTQLVVRVSIPTESVMPVRIVGGSMRVRPGGTELPLRDSPSPAPIDVAPGHPRLLSFQVGYQVVPDDAAEVECVVKFECGGAPYESDPRRFALKKVAVPAEGFPDRSPYIFGRAIESHEIDEHFFGRDPEQVEIFDSIRGGQQRLRYVEGIRRAGKSSLLHSIQHAITRDGLPIHTLYYPALNARSVGAPGKFVFNLLSAINGILPVRALPLDAELCESNVPQAFAQFQTDLREAIAEGYVLVLLDDFNVLPELIKEAKDANDQVRASEWHGFINLIEQHATTSAKLLWVFAGQAAFKEFRRLAPGVSLWAKMRTLPIDFLSAAAVREIVAHPLRATKVIVPTETTDRIQLHSGGYPESVQEMADWMLKQAMREKRTLITPADADCAAAALSEQRALFADTWFPEGEINDVQLTLVNILLKAKTPLRTHQLSQHGSMTDEERTAYNDLEARKILRVDTDGLVHFKAGVLESWLRRWIEEIIAGRKIGGAAAVFIDLPNLCKGESRSVIEFNGQRTPLEDVIKVIEGYAQALTPVPLRVRWAVNYPSNSPAVQICRSRDYQVKDIPEDLMKKARDERRGTDDSVLQGRIYDTAQVYTSVTQFVIVVGDKDYYVTIDTLLGFGKWVHVLHRSGTLAGRYTELARRFPDRLIVKEIEQLR